MRVFKSYTKKGVQVSYLELAHKYLLKFEKGPTEITYKFRKGPGLESHAEVQKFEEEYAFEKGHAALMKAEQERAEIVENYFKDQFNFEEII